MCCINVTDKVLQAEYTAEKHEWHALQGRHKSRRWLETIYCLCFDVVLDEVMMYNSGLLLLIVWIMRTHSGSLNESHTRRVSRELRAISRVYCIAQACTLPRVHSSRAAQASHVCFQFGITNWSRCQLCSSQWLRVKLPAGKHTWYAIQQWSVMSTHHVGNKFLKQKVCGGVGCFCNQLIILLILAIFNTYFSSFLYLLSWC